MDLLWLRRQFLIAIARNATLRDLLFLKGGNALGLIYEIGERASLDIDYSLEGELDDPVSFGEALRAAVTDHLALVGLIAFDWIFESRPNEREPGNDPRWGGYQASFKVIDEETHQRLLGTPDRLRHQAIRIAGDGQSSQIFKLDLSKHEFCGDVLSVELEGTTVQVYSLALIALEKLRALCQQLDAYGRPKRAPRPRDVYDIHAIVTEGGVDLSNADNRALLQEVFAAKDVSPRLLASLRSEREFHRQGWPAVLDTIPADRNRVFDDYFDFTLRLIDRLEALGVVDAP